MKSIPYLLFAILLGACLLSSCETAGQPTPTPLPESMKGYELYSWQDGSQWKFSLLTGTNREKTLEEIQSSDVVLTGVEALLTRLDQLPSGEYVTWTAKEVLSFPPSNIIQQVEELCKEKELILNISQ